MPKVLSRYPDIIIKLLSGLDDNKTVLEFIDTSDALEIQKGGYLNINTFIWIGLIIIIIVLSLYLGVYLAKRDKQKEPNK